MRSKKAKEEVKVGVSTGFKHIHLIECEMNVTLIWYTVTVIQNVKPKAPSLAVPMHKEA